VYIPFLVRVRGVDAQGEEFDTNTALENLSVSGLHMKLGHKVAPGDWLFAILTLATSSDNGKLAGRVAVRGLVQRIDKSGDGFYDLAMRFTGYRFL
jgi:hypothetical protein